MEIATLKLENPYWDEVKEMVIGEQWSWGIEYSVDPMRDPKTGEYRKLQSDAEKQFIAQKSRHAMVKKYGWTIPDPKTVEFVVDHCQGKVLDPLAGTGYWGYLLNQVGVQIFSSDKALPADNEWHRDQTPWTPIFQHDILDALEIYKPDTLFLSWVPYCSEIGTKAVQKFEGGRIIYVGESSGGCCADDSLFEEFENWEEVRSHRPIQWSGMHDYVTIYDRKVKDGSNTG